MATDTLGPSRTDVATLASIGNPDTQSPFPLPTDFRAGEEDGVDDPPPPPPELEELLVRLSLLLLEDIRVEAVSLPRYVVRLEAEFLPAGLMLSGAPCSLSCPCSLPWPSGVRHGHKLPVPRCHRLPEGVESVSLLLSSAQADLLCCNIY